jgi:Na+/phosphate symporter
MDINKGFEWIVPKPLKKWIGKRFDASDYNRKIKNQKDAPSFDLIRASVNLTVASALIALGTSLKLPLSTTYVTFMVAMGSSLADNAWGRESAVYRVTGVITVIGGWFFTAFVAFTSAFVLALVITKGGSIAIIGFIVLAIFMALRTHLIFLKREKAKTKIKKLEDEDLKVDDIYKKCSLEVRNMLKSVIKVFNDTIIGLTKEDRKILKKVCKEVDELNVDSKNLKANVHNTLLKLQTNEEEIETGPYYVQVIDYLREMAHALAFISHPSYEHIDNNHRGLSSDQVDELKDIKEDITLLFESIILTVEKNKFENLPDLIENQQRILNKLTNCRKKQIKRIKNNESGTRNSVLYLGILNEIKNFLLQSINLVKAQRDFTDLKD